MADDRLKSAYELAMERFKRKDAQDGIVHSSLSEEQKAAIAVIRSRYQAKIAELEILHRGTLQSMFDPAERERAEEEYRRERDRLNRERDARMKAARETSGT